MRPLALLLILTSAAFAQAGRSELFGTVNDPTGLPIQHAAIEADEMATGVAFKAATDQTGNYHLLGLPVGQYSLTVEQPGFRTYKQTGLTLRLADQVRLDIGLEIGQPAQSVDVTAQTPL